MRLTSSPPLPLTAGQRLQKAAVFLLFPLFFRGRFAMLMLGKSPPDR